MSSEIAYKLFIDGLGTTGVPLNWAARDLAEAKLSGKPFRARLRIWTPSGCRDPKPEEVKALADATAKRMMEKR